MKKSERGFTLIELVIVVAIIGILALMVIPQFKKTTEEAKISRFKYNCEAVCSAMLAYSAETGGSFQADIPTINGGLKNLQNSDTKNAVYIYNGPGGDPVFYAEYKNDSVRLTYSIGADGKVTRDW